MLQRDKYAGLSAFLVIQRPATDYFCTWWGVGGYTGSKAQWFNWLEAETVDIGQPTGLVPSGKTAKGTRGAYLYQSGTDPANTSQSYAVYARDYTGGLVLYRPPTANGPYTAASAVIVNLPGAMRQVGYDGALGPPVSSVSLRNAEGAILQHP